MDLLILMKQTSHAADVHHASDTFTEQSKAGFTVMTHARGMLIWHGPPSDFGPYHAIAVVWEAGQGNDDSTLDTRRFAATYIVVQGRFASTKNDYVVYIHQRACKAPASYNHCL